MSFYIRLDEERTAKISSWRLTSRLMNEILEHLYEELAENPWGHLVRLPEPRAPYLYNFIVRAEGDPPRDYLFDFLVRIHADEDTLIICDCDFLPLEAGPG